MATENKTESAVDIEQQKRRKIVKGIAGLPALVTLASGANAAATSNAEQCLLKPQPTKESLAKYPDPSDPDNPKPRLCVPSADRYLSTEIYSDSGDTLAAARRDTGTEYCLIDQNGNDATSLDDPLVTPSCYTSFTPSA